ncbi:MAG: ABC transporter permease [Nanoarchaeota archaeon]
MRILNKKFLLLLFIFLAVWQTASSMNLLNPFILPSPLKITLAFYSLLVEGKLITDILASLRRVLTGFLISTLIAVPLGILLGTNKKLKQLFMPLINFLRPIPPIAWIPLAILWFGIGNGPAYFITMIASFFPIFLNTFVGVENISRENLEVARCFGFNKKMMLVHVIMPSSLPFILTGMRIGLGIAWMAVIGAEMIAAFSGLGYLITISQEMLQMEKVIVGMITIGMLGLFFDNLMLKIKSLVVKWD